MPLMMQAQFHSIIIHSSLAAFGGLFNYQTKTAIPIFKPAQDNAPASLGAHTTR
jgi:hypothetical protein